MAIAEIISLVFLIIFSGLFSGTETAMMSVSDVKVNSLYRQKKRGAAALYRMKQNPHRLIITILIGNNVVNVAASALATVVFTEIFGSSGVGITTGVMTFFILVFGEISPKTFSSQNAQKVSLIASRPLEILSIILFPFVKMFEAFSRFVNRMVGSKGESSVSADDLRTMVTLGVKKGIISNEAEEVMHNALRFRGIKVSQIMTPDVRAKMIDGNESLNEVMDSIIGTSYSRYPVFLGNRDNVIGIVDVDDVLRYVKNKKSRTKVKNIIRETIFVPESKEADELISDFQSKKKEMAIVVDEYGDVSGVITIEDILEEIVGDIFDKNQRKKFLIEKESDKSYRVDGKILIRDLNDFLNLGFRKGSYNTLSGLIENKLRRIPKKGEKIKLDKITLEVERVTKQGIKTVRVIKR